ATRADAPPAKPRMLGDIAFQPCTLPSQMGAPGVEARCGSRWAAENPAPPQGRRIGLNTAWLPAGADGDRQPDPVSLRAGGPGQSATASYPAVASAFKDVLKRRGVVLVDQRGAGKSSPLQCGDLADAEMSADEAQMQQAMLEAVERCRD